MQAGSNSENPKATARWACRFLLIAALAGFAGGLLIQAIGSTPDAFAQETNYASDGKVFAIAGKVSRDTYGVYLVDTQRGTIAIYQFLPNERKLRLMAARTYTFDMQLDDYNSAAPSPADVKKMVGKANRLKDTGRSE
ncbi:MAG: hypothetical protein ACLFVU_02650 [Phycisphaerae bacterium]